MQHLQPNTLLQNGKYKIENVLGQGGFGITYVALQTGLNRKVVVKEFFMKEYCERNSDTSFVALGTSGSHELVKSFKEKFIKEAQNIAALNHQHIIRIHDIFEENGTAYYVMEYHEKGSLQTLLDSCHTLSETEALRYIRQIADALRYIHTRKMNHLDVKPANILLDERNNTVLIDFGLSKHYDEAGHQSSTTLVGISHGYAPLEHYRPGGVEEFSPATDIYSLGATLYRMLIGMTPPDANEVNEDGLPDLPATISSGIRTAIASAMQPRRKDRPQSIDAFLSMLDNGKNTVIPPLPKAPKQTPQPDETKILQDEKTPALENFTQTVNGVSFNMIAVKGGTFTMGATPEQGNDAYDFEKPAHQVTLSDYYIGETEVTQELWQAVMGSNPSLLKGNLQRPVEWVSWDDCQKFIKKLNQLTGKTFRLPTEAEWEYAARGGNKSRGYKYAGSNNIDAVAWHGVNSEDKGDTHPDYGTHPVKQRQANELGIYDMSGNVWEWCQDWYGDYSSSSQTNPTGPSSGYDRILRGGSWGSSVLSCRVSIRGSYKPADRDVNFGLRLVLTPQDNSNAVEEQPEPSELTTASDIENFTETVKGVSFNMIAVKGGTFTMGATSEQDSDASGYEKPAHEVILSDYYIGETEVTQELWQAVMGSNPSRFKGNLQRPVEYVSWEDCQEFIKKLNQLTGKTFRLPTEAEWEYAARGGNKSRGYKYAGSNNIGDVAWYDVNSYDKGKTHPDYGTHPVKQKKANELGLYDMTGNVWEWCQDWYVHYSSTSRLNIGLKTNKVFYDTNPTGPSSGSRRVLRGGSWIHNAARCLVSFCSISSPTYRISHYGLRLVLTPQDNSNAVEEQPEPSDVTPISDIENFTDPVKGVSFNMIAVKGGTFTMGAMPEQGDDADDDEKPAHQVTLSDYYIGETEVTQELWQAVMGSNPSYITGNLQRPVEMVSRDDCQEFINKLNQLTGKTFRLPTEAEWEYAARGGNKSRGYKYAGSDSIDDVAWYDVNSYNKGPSHPDYGTHPVKQKQANELGIYDMSGNVWEWCQDWYGDYSSSSQTNPTGPYSGSYRVLRGGSWGSLAAGCRVSIRSYFEPSYRDNNFGLRLAL